MFIWHRKACSADLPVCVMPNYHESATKLHTNKFRIKWLIKWNVRVSFYNYLLINLILIIIEIYKYSILMSESKFSWFFCPQVEISTWIEILCVLVLWAWRKRNEPTKRERPPTPRTRAAAAAGWNSLISLGIAAAVLAGQFIFGKIRRSRDAPECVKTARNKPLDAGCRRLFWFTCKFNNPTLCHFNDPLTTPSPHSRVSRKLKSCIKKHVHLRCCMRHNRNVIIHPRDNLPASKKYWSTQDPLISENISNASVKSCF